MDIYGYPAYQYNRSDELAKQMFAQQALASSLPYNRDNPGPHVMPAPSEVPWNVQGLSWGLSSPPQLVQFTAHPQIEPVMTPVVHCKRKSLEVEPVIPAKQLITEEKMAAHLNSLHISSEYTSHSFSSEEFMDINMDSPSTSGICDKLKGHKIVLSEELKKIQKEPLLPAALIERLEKPQMSLVVWTPRENLLFKPNEVNEENKPEYQEEEVKRRNGVLVAEPSGMDIEM